MLLGSLKIINTRALNQKNCSIVIVNYNQKALLEKCVQSLLSMHNTSCTIIVVDNGSHDGSQKMLREKYSQVMCIEVGRNSGYCEGNNIGIRKALEGGSEVVILLNNDTQVDPFFLDEMLLSVDEEQKKCMVAPKVLQTAHSDRIDSTGLLITPDGIAKTRSYQELDSDTIDDQNFFCPSGTAALFTRELLEDIVYKDQYFDEDFVFYVEEVDLGWRARLRGWQSVYNPQAIVYHERRSSTDAFPSLRIFYANRNNYYNLIKNYPGAWYLWKGLSLAISRYPLLLMQAFKGKGVAHEAFTHVQPLRVFILVCRGFWDVARHLPKLLRKRKYIQERCLIDKREIDKLFCKYGLTYKKSLNKI